MIAWTFYSNNWLVHTCQIVSNSCMQHHGTHTESGLGDPHVVHVKLAGSWRHHLHAGLCNQLGQVALHSPTALKRWQSSHIWWAWRSNGNENTGKNEIFRTWLLIIGHHWRYLLFDVGDHCFAMVEDTKKTTWQDTARCSSSHRPTKPLDPRIQVPNGWLKFNNLCRWSVVKYDPYAINCDYD